MTLEPERANGATETPIAEPRRESGGPALKTRDRAQYEAVLALQKAIAPESFLKDFAPRLIDAGLESLGGSRGRSDESAAANDEIRMLRKVAAEAKTMAATIVDQAAEIERMTSLLSMRDREIEQLCARVPSAEAHAHPAAASMSRDDMIRTALAGVVAHARKGSRTRMALDALDAIRVAIGAPDLATAIADAAMYRESRLGSLDKQKNKAKPTADDSEAT